MSPRFAAELVRRWVAIYTLGLPAQTRQDRRDEIEDDLWSQVHEPAADVRHDGSLYANLMMRLLLGIPADLSWRAEQSRLSNVAPVAAQHTTVSVRPVALMAMFGGAGWTLWPLAVAFVGAGWDSANPLSVVIFVGVILGGLAQGGATMGLILACQDRVRPGVAMLGSITAAIGSFSFMGVYGGVIGLFFGSALIARELSRIGVLAEGISRAHAIAATAAGVAVAVFLANPSVASSRVAFALFLLIVPYGLTWIAIGWSLRHGAKIAVEGAAG